MNRTSADKIKSATPFLIWFRRCLPDRLQGIVRPYLDQPYQLALNVLDCCSTTQPLVVAEIAQLAGVTRETARQVLLALKEGGMTFAVCSPQGWQSLALQFPQGEIAPEAVAPNFPQATSSAKDKGDFAPERLEAELLERVASQFSGGSIAPVEQSAEKYAALRQS